jgi:hypothetical protein
MHFGISVETGEEKITLADLAHHIGAMVFLRPFQPGIGVGEKAEVTLAAWESVVAGHVQRLEFPRFDGTGVPLCWIHRYECYFRSHRTLENRRIAYAAFHYLDGAQLWYHWLPDNGNAPTWVHFVPLVSARFGPQFTVKPSSTPTMGSDNLSVGDLNVGDLGALAGGGDGLNVDNILCAGSDARLVAISNGGAISVSDSGGTIGASVLDTSA